jgi:hypothetical protein
VSTTRPSDAVIEAVRKLLAELEPASLRTRHESDEFEQKLIVKPTRSENAAFWLAVGDKDSYDFGFGHGPFFENLSVETYPPVDLVRAAIEGNVRETLTIARGKIRYSAGELTLPNGEKLFSTVNVTLVGSLWWSRKESVIYSPYPRAGRHST